MHYCYLIIKSVNCYGCYSSVFCCHGDLNIVSVVAIALLLDISALALYTQRWLTSYPMAQLLHSLQYEVPALHMTDAWLYPCDVEWLGWDQACGII